MIWLLTRPVVMPFKVGRMFGYRRVTVFLLGAAVGLLLAPVPGRELRAMLQDRLAPMPPGGEDTLDLPRTSW